jgi:hypothetical protein
MIDEFGSNHLSSREPSKTMAREAASKLIRRTNYISSALNKLLPLSIQQQQQHNIRGLLYIFSIY